MFSRLLVATSDPYSYTGGPGAASGSPATTKEAARAWAYGQDQTRACTKALAGSFVVAGDPKAAPRSPAYECGSEIANLADFHMPDSARAARLQISARLPGY